MHTQPSLAFTTLVYTITLTLIVQITFLLFAISAVQRAQFGSLAEFSVGVLSAAHTAPGQVAPTGILDTFCSEDAKIDNTLIDLLNRGLMAQGRHSGDEPGILTLAYNCVNRKVTSLESPTLLEGTQGFRTSMMGDDEGGIVDLINSFRLLWNFFTDRKSTVYTIEYMTVGVDTTVLLSFNKSYLVGLLSSLLSQYVLAVGILVGLNVLFVFILVRYFVTNPIWQLTKSLQSLTRTSLQTSKAIRRRFHFREIHEANRALQAISDLLESRRTIEDRKDGMNHEIRNDLQRLYGQIYQLNLPEDSERLLHLSLDRLSNRLSDVLEFVTWQKGDLKRETINLAEMAERCAELSINIGRLMISDESKRPVLVSKIPEDIEVNTNREALRIILENLFRNSVDAFNIDSKAELRDSLLRQLAREQDDEKKITVLRDRLAANVDLGWERCIIVSAIRKWPVVHIMITDNADGIQFGLRDSVFLHGVTSSPDDNVRRGIGLLFARILIEDLNGTITLRSTRHRDDIMRELLALPSDRVATVTPAILNTGTTFEMVVPAA